MCVCVVVVVCVVLRLTQLCVWCLHSPGEGSTKEAIARTGNSKVFNVSAVGTLKMFHLMMFMSGAN